MTMARRIMAVLLSAGSICLAGGCGNTLSGAKQDVSQDTQQVRTTADQAVEKTTTAARTAEEKTTEAMHNAGTTVKGAVSNAGAAATVTPEVKTAILRDPVLNDPRNLIKVTSHSHQAILNGHVMTPDMKQRATEDAQVVLNKRHPDYTVVNDLTITGS
jgi:predicted small secreted protein